MLTDLKILRRFRLLFVWKERLRLPRTRVVERVPWGHFESWAHLDVDIRLHQLILLSAYHQDAHSAQHLPGLCHIFSPPCAHKRHCQLGPNTRQVVADRVVPRDKK